MNETVAMVFISPDTLFVIACPVCHGHLAATRSLCGSDACCPLCASLFHVPLLDQPTDAATPGPSEPALAEDWGRVIDKLIAPPEKPEPVPLQPESTSDFELAPEFIPDPTPVPPPEPTPPQPGLFETMAEAPLSEPLIAEAVPVPRATVSEPDASADWIDKVLESAETPENPEPPREPEAFPHLGAALLAPADQDLTFREPVRTIRQGDTVFEIRRLTPEERKSRRFRRNLMMIVVGVSILLAIVVIFGVPTKPPR